MINLPGGSKWTPSEAAAVNEFLNSPVGRKWLGELLARKPRVDTSSTERAAITGAFAAGYEQLLFGEIVNTRTTVPSDMVSTKGIDPTKD